MGNAEQTVVAGNGTVVEAGGVYLTFSGDSELPYRVAKIISVGGGPIGAAMDCQLAPDLTPLPSPDLWLKLWYTKHTEPQHGLPPAGERYRIMPVSAGMFLAWGPPKFPIRVGTEAVTAEELAARVEDWWQPGEQSADRRATGDGTV